MPAAVAEPEAALVKLRRWGVRIVGRESGMVVEYPVRFWTRSSAQAFVDRLTERLPRGARRSVGWEVVRRE